MPMLPFELAEHLLFQGVQWLRWLIEAAGALVIALGLVMSVRGLWAAEPPPGSHGLDRFTAMRLSLGRYLALALELQLAADVLSTALSPSWQDLGKLAAIAAIRTALNHFLAKESRELRAEHRLA